MLLVRRYYKQEGDDMTIATLRKRLAEAGTTVLRYDYDRQAWIRDGIVLPCGHLTVPRAGCYACAHAGEAYGGEE